MQTLSFVKRKMGFEYSKEIEAFGEGKESAMKSLEILLLIKYNVKMEKERNGKRFVRNIDGRRCYVIIQKIEPNDKSVYYKSYVKI